MIVAGASPRSGWHVLRHRGFTLFFLMRILSAMGRQIVAVAVGWQVYDLTRNPADLGFTPDHVRGRVNAVTMVFTGASNEIGGFRAGIIAALIGVVPAVAFGGIGTIGIAAFWAYKFPELRHIRQLSGRHLD